MRTLTTKRGFTLVEHVVVIVVLGILSAVLAVIIITGASAFNAVAASEALMNEAEYSLDRMAREIRNAGGADGIMEIGREIFHFTDVYGNDIKFSAENGALLRNGRVLADNLGELSFGYLDSDGNTAAGPEDVRRVKIELTLTGRGREVKVETLVRTRN